MHRPDLYTSLNIIDHCTECKTPSCINFIFQKAFDSVHWGALWKSDGVPPKMVTLTGLFYCKFECSVIVDGYFLHLLTCKDLKWRTAQENKEPDCSTGKQTLPLSMAWARKLPLRWSPPRKRRHDQPKTTWWNAVTADLEEPCLTWGEAQRAAHNCWCLMSPWGRRGVDK